jgi:hypothetical protein
MLQAMLWHALIIDERQVSAVEAKGMCTPSTGRRWAKRAYLAQMTE